MRPALCANGANLAFSALTASAGKTRKACASLIFHDQVWIVFRHRCHWRHSEARERNERISKISLHSR
jgi:hypothetical protein